MPRKDKFDKSSAKGKYDEIVYDKTNDGVDKLKGAFYIGVYGFQYSTFTLTVIVNRISHKQTDIFKIAQKLIQGVPE